MRKWIDAFYRKDKSRPFKLLEESEKYQKAFIRLVESSNDEPFAVIEEYICRLYNEKKISNVNEARRNIFQK